MCKLETVAVVITTFNHAQYLDEALRSVLAQTVSSSQIIVVDDGSTDNPAAVVERYANARLICTNNRELSAARNTGLCAVEARYVVFLDADDRLHSGAIAFGVAAHCASAGAAFVYGAHRRIDANGAPTGRINYLPVLAEPFGGLLRGNRIGMHACVMYKSDVIRSVGGFEEALSHCEDYEIYLRIAERALIVSHPHLVADYRIHGMNMSANHRMMLATALGVQARFQGRGDQAAAASSDGRARFRAYYGEQALRSEPGVFGLANAMGVAPNWAVRHASRVVGHRIVGAICRLAFDFARMRGTQGSPPLGQVQFGDLRRVTPVSRDFGWDRGRPIDRYYIEDFLGRNADAIVGNVLEVGDDSYSRRFGAERVIHQDVLHLRAGMSGATINGDISTAGTLPAARFDCIIFTQTLHLVFDMRAAIDQLHAALRPGGVLLLTTPGISPIDRGEWADNWFWSLSSAALARLLALRFDVASTEIKTFGNVFAATAFLHGICCEEVDVGKLLPRDKAYPVVITARAERR